MHVSAWPPGARTSQLQAPGVRGTSAQLSAAELSAAELPTAELSTPELPTPELTNALGSIRPAAQAVNGLQPVVAVPPFAVPLHHANPGEYTGSSGTPHAAGECCPGLRPGNKKSATWLRLRLKPLQRRRVEETPGKQRSDLDSLLRQTV